MSSHTYLCPSSRTYYYAHTHTHAYTHTPSHTSHILATRSSWTLLLKNVRLTHFTTKNSQCICLVQNPLVFWHVCQFSLGLPCHSRPPNFFVLSLFLRLRVKNWNWNWNIYIYIHILYMYIYIYIHKNIKCMYMYIYVYNKQAHLVSLFGIPLLARTLLSKNWCEAWLQNCCCTRKSRLLRAHRPGNYVSAGRCRLQLCLHCAPLHCPLAASSWACGFKIGRDTISCFLYLLHQIFLQQICHASNSEHLEAANGKPCHDQGPAASKTFPPQLDFEFFNLRVFIKE